MFQVKVTYSNNTLIQLSLGFLESGNLCGLFLLTQVNPGSSTLLTFDGLPSKSDNSLEQDEKSNKENETNFILQHLESLPGQQDLMQLLKIGKQSWTFVCGNSR